MKGCYNFKHIFDEPSKIRRFWKLTLPFAIPVARIMIFAVTLLILFAFFRGIISFLNSIVGGLQYVIYAAVPWMISGAILKMNPDGQKLHHFLFGLLKFWFTIYSYRKRFCCDEVVELPEKAVFEKYNG